MSNSFIRQHIAGNTAVCYTFVRKKEAEPIGKDTRRRTSGMNENVKRLLKKNIWDLATSDGKEPNVVPVAFKDVTEDGKLTVGDIFLETTLKNLEASGWRIAVSVYDAETMEGYQIKGTAEYRTEGAVVDGYRRQAEQMFKGRQTAKGALVITPEKIIVTTPGPENKKVL